MSSAAVAPLRRSLRGKVLALAMAALLYLAFSVGYISWERNGLYHDVHALEQVAQHEKLLVLADASVAGALIDASEASSAAVADPPSPMTMALYIEACRRQFEALERIEPAYTVMRRAIDRAWNELNATPDRSGWIGLREALARASSALEIRRATLGAERDRLNQTYRRRYDAVTIESLLLAIVGFVGFGTAAAWFIARLAHDVRRLESHAQAIVRGARGVALDVRRDDELGQLMHAVNRMAVDLDHRERQIELDGQRQSHQEKMLAVGALAAGVAHEVNNPLAVISGIAQELQAARGPLPSERVNEAATALLEQSRRAAQAARQLSDLVAPQPADQDWIDVNAMVRDAVRLMGYDKRYRAVRIELTTDMQLPAVRSSGTALQQVVMQMLALAAGAVAPLEGAALHVDTAVDSGRACLQWRFPPALTFTQPEVQRSLLLSRALIEPIGGRLALGQDGQGGQRITLSLPLESSATE